MLIIAGLGNPGSKYAGHRHNVGFMAADEIVRRHSFGPWKSKFQGEISEGTIDGQKAIILKPATYMNESGRSLAALKKFYKLDNSDFVVIYDELDLAPGKLRIKVGGGTGGHNGIRSIDAHLGKDYRRMRVGIGHPGHKDKVTSHVLGDFAKADHQWLDPLLSAIADHSALLAGGEDSTFMNRVHLAIDSDEPRGAAGSAQTLAAKKTSGKNNKQKATSHIHQARSGSKPSVPKSGPMADMLKKLFGNKE